MLDINMFRSTPEVIRKDHDKRGIPHTNIDRVIELDQSWINLQHETNQLRATKNAAARGIGAAKKSGDDEAAQRILAEVADLGAQIAALERKTEEAVEERDQLRMRIPNILHEDVPEGPDESGNTVHSSHGRKPEFTFESTSIPGTSGTSKLTCFGLIPKFPA